MNPTVLREPLLVAREHGCGRCDKFFPAHNGPPTSTRWFSVRAYD